MAPQSSVRRWERWSWIVGASVMLAGCAADAPRDGGRGVAAQAVEKAWESKTLPWGTGQGQVGLRPAAKDLPAEGPSAVAVGPEGEVLVLDRLNERVVEITAGGQVRT